MERIFFMTHDDYMRRAIALSRTGMEKNEGGPFGAVIVMDGKIVGEGHNLVVSTNDPTAHGEIVAIRNATSSLNSFSLEGAVIYTSCEPCPMCFAAIHWARIGHIYYGNTAEDAAAIGFDDAAIYGEIAKPRGARQTPSSQVLPVEAKIVFEAWAKKQDRVNY